MNRFVKFKDSRGLTSLINLNHIVSIFISNDDPLILYFCMLQRDNSFTNKIMVRCASIDDRDKALDIIMHYEHPVMIETKYEDQSYGVI